MRTTTTTTAALLAATAAGCAAARYWYHGRLSAAQHDANHDPLTGLLNRAGFTTTVRQVRAVWRVPMLVAVVDLVGFKAVNDTHGHAAGDRVLTVVAGRLRHAAGTGGVAARLGGDEFVILTRLDQPTGDAAAWAGWWLVDTHTQLTEPVTLTGGVQLRVGATIGAALTEPATALSSWLHQADAAMYTARAQRRTTALYSPQQPPPTASAVRVRDLARPTSHSPPPKPAAPTAPTPAAALTSQPSTS